MCQMLLTRKCQNQIQVIAEAHPNNEVVLALAAANPEPMVLDMEPADFLVDDIELDQLVDQQDNVFAQEDNLQVVPEQQGEDDQQ